MFKNFMNINCTTALNELSKMIPNQLVQTAINRGITGKF